MSRIVWRLKALLTTWHTCDLRSERNAILVLVGFHPKVRVAKGVVAERVLGASGLLTDLHRRAVPALLLVTEGRSRLKKAVEAWSNVRVRRCTTHKGRDLASVSLVHPMRK